MWAAIRRKPQTKSEESLTITEKKTIFLLMILKNNSKVISIHFFVCCKITVSSHTHSFINYIFKMKRLCNYQVFFFFPSFLQAINSNYQLLSCQFIKFKLFYLFLKNEQFSWVSNCYFSEAQAVSK